MASVSSAKKKTRRKSLGYNIAEESKCIVGESEDGLTSITKNLEMSNELISLYGSPYMEVSRKNIKDIKSPDHFNSLLQNNDKICVGLVFRFSLRHIIPYILIGGEWYNGDNEYGYLRKLIYSPPSPFIRYTNIRGKRYNSENITDILFYYSDPKLISGSRIGKDFSGTPTFGQTDKTCGPDSIQTVFMYADGFYEWYKENIYENLKQRNILPDSRFSYSKIRLNEYEIEDLEEEVDRLLPLYPPSMRTAESEAPLRFLTIMFIRYYSYETMPEEARNYAIVHNNSIANNALIKKLRNNNNSNQLSMGGRSSIRTRKAKLKSNPPHKRH